jgi:hypothetical protein
MKLKNSFTIYDLPKVSLNEFYSGKHWSKRKKYKDQIKFIVKSQVDETINYACDVEYEFFFKNRPLDCSNCVALLKMVEDCIFPKDDIKIVKSIKVTSRKAKEDVLYIKVKEY